MVTMSRSSDGTVGAGQLDSSWRSAGGSGRPEPEQQGPRAGTTSVTWSNPCSIAGRRLLSSARSAHSRSTASAP